MQGVLITKLPSCKKCEEGTSPEKGKVPYFNYPHARENVGRFCYDHKEKGMINLLYNRSNSDNSSNSSNSSKAFVKEYSKALEMPVMSITKDCGSSPPAPSTWSPEPTSSRPAAWAAWAFPSRAPVSSKSPQREEKEVKSNMHMPVIPNIPIVSSPQCPQKELHSQKIDSQPVQPVNYFSAPDEDLEMQILEVTEDEIAALKDEFITEMQGELRKKIINEKVNDDYDDYDDYDEPQPRRSRTVTIDAIEPESEHTSKSNSKPKNSLKPPQSVSVAVVPVSVITVPVSVAEEKEGDRNMNMHHFTSSRMKGNNHARSRVSRLPRSGDGTFVKRSNIIVNQERQRQAELYHSRITSFDSRSKFLIALPQPGSKRVRRSTE